MDIRFYLNRIIFSRRGKRGITAGIAVILLSASAMKLHHLRITAMPLIDHPIPSYLSFAVICIEAAFACWLLSGVHSRLAWKFGAACFALFLSLAVRDTLDGKSSCGCFGELVTPPWLVGLFDLVALSFFIFATPPRGTTFFFAALATLASLGLGVALSVSVLTAYNEPRLSVIPHVVTLAPANLLQVTRSRFTLFNPTPFDIEIDRVETSCHCLSVQLSSSRVGAGQNVTGHAEIDPRRRPGSGGNLSLTVQGYGMSGAVVFSLRVECLGRSSSVDNASHP